MGLFDSLSGILDSGNHDSILGAVGKPIQKWTDPLSWATGGKWADWTSTDIPRASNQALSKVMTPFDRVDETINPVRRFVPGVDEVGDVVRDKPASAIGTAVGAMFGGGALLGGMGAGGAGGAAGGGAAAGGSGGGLGGLFSGIGGGTGGLGTGLASGGSAAGYGGGVSSSVLPGIFQGATVAPQGAAGVGSFSGGLGGLGAFGGGAGTGSITGAGSTGGLGLNSGGLDWMQMAQQGQKMLNQNQQQQQQQQQRPAPMDMGGGGGNMRGLFSNLMQQRMQGRQLTPTTGIFNHQGY